MDDLHQAWQWLQSFASWAVPGTVELLKALAAPIIALAALRVSRQQVRINESKLRLDLYDRRLKVYGGVKDLLGAFFTNGGLTQEDLATFRGQVVETDFLFGLEVQQYVKALDDAARRLIIETHRYRRPPLSDTEEAVDRYAPIEVLDDWFIAQPAKAKAVFHPFLNLGS